MKMTRVITIGCCQECPYCVEDYDAGNHWCVICNGKVIPEELVDDGIPIWCKLEKK